MVNALQFAGAATAGKTVTTEYVFMMPGPTTDPYAPNSILAMADLARFAIVVG